MSNSKREARKKMRACNVGIRTTQPTSTNHKRTQEMLEMEDSFRTSGKKGKHVDDLQGSPLMAVAVVQSRQVL